MLSDLNYFKGIIEFHFRYKSSHEFVKSKVLYDIKMLIMLIVNYTRITEVGTTL